MIKKEIRKIQEIGDILFVKDSRNKFIRITVKPFKGIRVSFPWHASKKQVENFILQNKQKIIEIKSDIQKYENKISSKEKIPIKIETKVATEFLYHRLIELADKFDFSFNKVVFRNQKTRWGSCSIKNNLSLNIQIFLLPPHLQDYILLHELMHTKIKNHSHYYWKSFAKILPDVIQQNREMRNYKIKKCTFL